MTFVKSKQRVADHGEVFTPVWMVQAMLHLVKDEILRYSSAFRPEDSMFAHLEKHKTFTPTRTWPATTVGDLPAGFVQLALARPPKRAA
jgi:hypothetical protein